MESIYASMEMGICRGQLELQWIKMATAWSEIVLENVLCFFNPHGKLVHSVPTTGSPLGVSLDKEGFVYVVDYGNSCVYKF